MSMNVISLIKDLYWFNSKTSLFLSYMDSPDSSIDKVIYYKGHCAGIITVYVSRKFCGDGRNKQKKIRA